MGGEREESWSAQLADLRERLHQLEGRVAAESGADSMGAGMQGHCSLPPVAERRIDSDVSPGRARLIRYLDKKWVNGTKLRYYFFDQGSMAGSSADVALVRQAFVVWKDQGIGIAFEEVNTISEAEIRIGFLRGDGAWSYVGRDVIDVPGQNERTMNFGRIVILTGLFHGRVWYRSSA